MSGKTYYTIANKLRQDDPEVIIKFYMKSGQVFSARLNEISYEVEYLILQDDDGTKFLEVASIEAMTI